MTTPLGPTPEDIEEYGTIDGNDPTIEVTFDTEVTSARVELTFDQVDQIVEAGRLVGELPITFMRNAAMARAEELLAQRSEQAESPAAGGG